MSGEPDLPAPGVKPVEALRYFRAKGFQIGFDWRDVEAEEHARAFTVAKAMRLDILVDIRTAMDAAIDNGETLATFSKKLRPVLEDKGWWGRSLAIDPQTGEQRVVQLGSPRRLETIYRTNMRTAQAAGRWERVQRSKKLFPYLIYTSVMDGRERPEHHAWHGTILPVDHPWWDSHYPPCGWGCRCMARPLNQRMMDSAGLSVTDDPPRFPVRDWTNKRTGEIQRVEQGIDPGWQHNVGALHLRAPVEHAVRSIDAAIGAGGLDVPAAATLRQIVDSPAFETFLATPTISFPVALLAESEAALLGATRRLVMLKPGVYAKQKRSHPELTLAAYRLLPGIVAAASVIIRQGDSRLLFVAFRDGGTARWWKAVVRQDAGEPYPIVISYQPADDRELRREAAKGEIIVDRRAE